MQASLYNQEKILIISECNTNHAKIIQWIDQILFCFANFKLIWVSKYCRKSERE